MHLSNIPNQAGKLPELRRKKRMEPKEITSSCWMRMLTMLTLSRDKWYHDIWWCSKQHLRVWIWSVRVRCGSNSAATEAKARWRATTEASCTNSSGSCFLMFSRYVGGLEHPAEWKCVSLEPHNCHQMMILNESYRYNEFAQPNSAYHPQIPASFKSPIRLQVSSNWKRQSSELQGEHLRRCPGNPAGPQIQSDFVQKRGAV